MTTAVIGAGTLGSQIVRNLAAGSEPVVIANQNEAKAAALASEVGAGARSVSVAKAIAAADTIVFAVWFEAFQELLKEHAGALAGKTLIDPTNPLGPDGKGGLTRTLPDDQSSGAILAGLVPSGTNFVKALGTLTAGALGENANRTPERAVLFYATDDAVAEPIIERLITTSGFDPLKVGGISESGRLEVGGQLNQFGGLDGQVVNLARAKEILDGSTRV